MQGNIRRSEENKQQGYRRNGFKVNLSLVETTKNFLDIVPNFKQYYNYATDKEINKKTDIQDSYYGKTTETETGFNLREFEKIKNYKISNKIKKEENGNFFISQEETNFFANMYRFSKEKIYEG